MNIQEILASIDSSGALASAADKAGLTPAQAHATLQGVAEHVDGGGGIEGMAEAVASKAGITPDQVRAFLPYVLPLLQQHAQTAPAALRATWALSWVPLAACSAAAAGLPLATAFPVLSAVCSTDRPRRFGGPHRPRS